MSDAKAASVHASAVLVGDRAVLIRGPSGSGKSKLAFALILAGRSGQIPHAVLVGDDRVHLEASRGQLVVRPVRELAGLIEIRGLGIRRGEFAEKAIVGLVVDLCAAEAERLPPSEALQACIDGVMLPRIPVAADYDPLPLAVAALTTAAGFELRASRSDDCLKGIGNHMRPTIVTK
jgi:serine kinase of HPr protein (carbohydrate metabolism regulator)